MINNFQANMAALEKLEPALYNDIKAIKENKRFDLTQTPDNTVKIYDTINKTSISTYEDNILHLSDCLLYKEHIYLYLFGISDTSIVSTLLKNKTHRRIVVVEPDTELLYVALHLHDFSADLFNGRLKLLLLNKLNTEACAELFSEKSVRFYVKSYTLLLTSSYYATVFKDEIQKANKNFLSGMEYIFTFSGNDIKDSLVGISQTIQNLPTMLSSPSLLDLRNAVAHKIGTVVLVSTGPSLTKQLPLLAKIQDHVTIISVDASLPILEKHNIVPDIVTSIERVEATAKFFDETAEAFRKKTITIQAVLQHEKAIKATENTPRILVLRPLDYNMYFNFKEYGYVGGGLSGSNLAHDIAFLIGAKTCILIGQDLSYGKDGKSHAAGHVFGVHNVPHDQGNMYIKGYGGEHDVLTQPVWLAFLKRFEQSATYYESLGMKTFNSTEGGARIEGTHELPFKEAIKQFVNKKETKHHIYLSNPTQETLSDNTEKLKRSLTTLISEGELLQSQIEKSFLVIADAITPYETLSFEALRLELDDKAVVRLLDEIEKIRRKISGNTVYKEFMRQTVESMLLPQEIELAVVKVKLVTSAEENANKAFQWIFRHKSYLFAFAGAIHNILETVKSNNPFDTNCK